MENKGEFARQIGSRIKELRKEVALTLKQLAKATELSAPLISKIENGLAMPSLPTLRLIADALKVNPGYFFRDEDERGYVISPQRSRRIIDSKKGYAIELVTEGMDNPFMEPAIVTLRGREQGKEVDLAAHEGQEFMYVLEGRIELFLGKKRYILKKGDAGYWNGSIPHMGVRLGKKPAKTLNVHLIPGMRVGTFETSD